MLATETYTGILIGGPNDGELATSPRNTLITVYEHAEVWLPGYELPTFYPCERARFQYLGGADGVGFWFPVRFGHPMVGFTELLSVLQQVYTVHAVLKKAIKNAA